MRELSSRLTAQTLESQLLTDLTNSGTTQIAFTRLLSGSVSAITVINLAPASIRMQIHRKQSIPAAGSMI